MLIISKEGVQGLKERLSDPARRDECRRELEKMLEIKGTLLWRAEAARGCCSIGWGLPAQLAGEVQTLEEALVAFDADDLASTASLLDEFIHQLG